MKTAVLCKTLRSATSHRLPSTPSLGNTCNFQICRHFSNKKSGSKRAWMKRHVEDSFVKQAQEEGQVSRSYYKLQQMDEKHSLLKNCNVVVELGAAPGGWSSYVSQHLKRGTTLVAIDLLPLDPKVVQQLTKAPCDAHIMQGDFRSSDIQHQLESILDKNKVELVISDMAANTTGDSSTDAARTMGLCESALELSLHRLLNDDGSFVTKYFSGADEVEFRNYARQFFRKVKTVKPPASRKQSPERYLIATGYRSNKQQ